MQNKSNLTDMQELFAVKFSETHDKLEAYKFAGYAQNGDLSKRASDVYTNPKVRARIVELAGKTGELADVTLPQVLRRFYDIATADPRELINLKIGCCRYCYGNGGAYQWREREFVEAVTKWEKLMQKNPKSTDPCPDPSGGLDFNPTLSPRIECKECFGEGEQRIVPQDTSKLSGSARLLYGGVKQTRNGIEIIMADRLKALEAVTRILGGFKDNLNANLEVKAMAAVINMETSNPEAASEAYQKLISGGLATF